MSSGPKTRSSRGPTSARGIYMKSVRAPGVSLDMPDEEPVKKMKKGGMARSSASKRADGCAVRGKTRGKMI